MMKINKNSEFVNDVLRNKLYEDFQLKVLVEIPDFKEESKELFAIRMRSQSPYVTEQGISYIDTLNNIGCQQYYLLLKSDGKLQLIEKEGRQDKEWGTVISSKGTLLRAPGFPPNVLKESTINLEKNKVLELQIIAVKGDIRIFTNGERVIHYKNKEWFFANGFIVLKALDYDINLVDVSVEEIETKLTVMELKATPMYTKGNPLKQLTKLHLINERSRKFKCFAEIKMGEMELETQAIGEIAVGENVIDLYLHEISESSKLKLKIYEDGTDKPIAEYETIWEPTKKWEIFIATSAHEDLGYCGHINKLMDDMALYLDSAKNICDVSANDSEEERYKYFIEHLWWLFGYENSRGSEKTKELIENYIKPGIITPIAVHSGTHTHWEQYEQMARSTYYASIEAKERYGLDLKTALFADVPGVSWSFVAPFAKAGIKYLLNCRGIWRSEVDHEKPGYDFVNDPELVWMWNIGKRSDLPELFYWVAPNGKDKILFNNVWSYSDRKMTSMLKKGYNYLLNTITKYLDAKMDFPYETLIEPIYFDHEIPNYGFVDTIKKWNSKWAYPKFLMSNVTDYFVHVEEKYKGKIPEIAGEMTENWADFATNDNLSIGKKRQTTNMMTRLEMLSVLLSSIEGTNLYPDKLLYDVMWRVMEFDEHCWATMPIPSLDNILNNYITKKGNMNQAHDKIFTKLNEIFAKLNKRIDVKCDYSLVAWNLLPRERNELVEANIKDIPFSNFDIINTNTGERVLYQKLSEDEIIFEAKNLPAFGYKTYELHETSSSQTFEKFAKIEAGKVSNAFYEIAFDAEMGEVTSIYDKELNKEILDKEAKYKFNQYLYVHTEHELSSDITIKQADFAKINIEEGPLALILKIEAEEKNSGAKILQKIILYKDVKRIDVQNRCKDVEKLLYEGEIGRCFGDMGNRYLDNVFFAFPFAVDNFNFNYEIAGGVVDMSKDLLRLGVGDYRILQNWVDVSNDDFGVALYSKDIPTMHFGQVGLNRFDLDYKPTSSHLYSYAASNRMAGLNTRSILDCKISCDYSIYSHGGSYHEAKVPEWSWNLSYPVTCQVISKESANTMEASQESQTLNAATMLDQNSSSFIAVDKSNVQITSIKFAEKAGEGLVLRLVETNGMDTVAKISLPFLNITKVNYATINEKTQEEIALIGKDEFQVDIGSFDFVTVKFKCMATEALTEVPTLLDVDITDNRAKLKLDKKEEVGYNIYRGDSLDFTPNAYNKVGTSYEAEFTDIGLNAGQTYFYRIARVDHVNNQGVLSEALAVTLSNENVSKPFALEELNVYVLDKNNLAIVWKISKEKDIVTYEIHRSINKEFEVSDNTLVKAVEAEPFYIQFYIDMELTPKTNYYYKVLPVDSNGNKNMDGIIAQAKTPTGDWRL